ncbi:phytanoyl-CoA dioxygenase family protein [Aquihabitans daechungensis]|uniref:phytanoyl-CoA dioxygenase family protein n=1 Tax=Aquihabitans daechungensis TaxID=1052257 RepID=UPI003BA13A29
MTTRPHLRDAALDARYEELGYVVLRGGAASSLRALRRVHRRVGGPAEDGFHSTMYSADQPHKERIHRELVEVLGPLLDEHLEGHRPLLASFITKGRGDTGRMPPHQDWTFVDEPEVASMNFWVPLVDVDQRNGAMSVLPRGHQVPHTIRGSDTQNPFREIEELAAQHMVEVPMRAGDVLVHDHRVLHASPPNERRRLRVVAGIAVVPAGAAIVHYRRTGPGTLDRYAVSREFFTEHTYGSPELPESAVKTDVVSFENPVLRPEDLPLGGVSPHQ